MKSVVCLCGYGDDGSSVVVRLLTAEFTEGIVVQLLL